MEETFGHGVRSAHDEEPRVGDVSDPSGPYTLLDRTFGRDDITMLRHEVSQRLTAAGLAGDRLHGYVLAVNEVITNVVLHAGGHGRLALRREGRSVWCLVTDSGPGIPGALRAAQRPPEAYQVGGRGLWLAHQLCDEVTMATGPIGTSIGLRMMVSGPSHPVQNTRLNSS